MSDHPPPARPILPSLLLAISCCLGLAACGGEKMLRTQMKHERAKLDVAKLTLAIEAYDLEYARLPLYDYGDREIPSGKELIDALSGKDANRNPRQRPFLKIRTGSGEILPGFIDEGGGSNSLLDPWGNRYMVKIDADDDGKILPPGARQPIKAKVIVWSYGPPPDPAAPASAKNHSADRYLISWEY